MVAGDHLHGDARVKTGNDSIARFFTRRIHDAEQPEQGESFLYILV